MPPRRPTHVRIEELTEKKAQLEAQIDALDARERLGQKKDEDRLKWLLGTMVFDRMSSEPALQEWVRRELPARLRSLRTADKGDYRKFTPKEILSACTASLVRHRRPNPPSFPSQQSVLSAWIESL